MPGVLHLAVSPGMLAVTAIDISRGKSRVQGHILTSDSSAGAWVVEMPTSRWGFVMTPGRVAVHPLVAAH